MRFLESSTPFPFYFAELDVETRNLDKQRLLLEVGSIFRRSSRGLISLVELKDDGRTPYLILRTAELEGKAVEVTVEAADRLRVWIVPLRGKLTREEAELIARRVELAGLYSAEQLRRAREANIYLVFVRRMSFAPERLGSLRERLMEKIFHGTMFFFFAISFLLGYLLYLLTGPYVLIFFPLVSLIILIFSDRLIAALADWELDETNRDVYIVEYSVPPSEYLSLVRRVKSSRNELKRAIYESSLAIGREPDPELVASIFERFGLPVDEHHRVSVRRIDLYAIVRRVFMRLGLRPPARIVLLNTIVPNAAAAGVSADLSAVAVTSGLLVMLDDEEVEAVLSHEASHVKNRDPLLMFALSIAEYVIRIIVITLLIYIGLGGLFGLLYLFVSLTALFFVAKFFEARADLEAALACRKPEALARALKKLGLRRLLHEHYPRSSLGAWFAIDPHPPISWRIVRLEHLRDEVLIEPPLLASAKECIRAVLPARSAP